MESSGHSLATFTSYAREGVLGMGVSFQAVALALTQ